MPRGNPFKEEDEDKLTEQIYFRLDKITRDWLDDQAKKFDRKPSYLLRELVRAARAGTIEPPWHSGIFLTALVGVCSIYLAVANGRHERGWVDE